MKSIILSLLMLFPLHSHAVEAIKCNTMSGKTLWAGFGRIVRSGEPEPIYYPIEFTVFKSHTELQDRVYFARTKDALAIKVSVSPVAIEFAFPSKNDGEDQLETFYLRRYSPKDTKAFRGTWTVSKDGGVIANDLVNCSVYK